MGRSYQGQDLALGLHIKATKPVADYMAIDTAADRLLPSTWYDKDDGNYYVHPSMITVCKDTGQIFTYIGKPNDPEDIANPLMWVTQGGGSLNMVLMEQEDLETLRAADCQEGVLYLGMGEILDSENAFVFGGKFPIQF